MRYEVSRKLLRRSYAAEDPVFRRLEGPRKLQDHVTDDPGALQEELFMFSGEGDMASDLRLLLLSRLESP